MGYVFFSLGNGPCKWYGQWNGRRVLGLRYSGYSVIVTGIGTMIVSDGCTNLPLAGF
jgi:hypothetical protein